MKHHIVYASIILFLCIILFKLECSKPIDYIKKIKIDGKKYDVLNKQTDTVYIHLKPQVLYKQGKNIYKDTVIYKDSLIFKNAEFSDGELERYYDSILRSHFAITVFKDTVKFGKYGNIYTIDSIQENTILSRMYNSDIVFPSIIKTTNVKKVPENKFYFGAKTVMSNNSIRAIGTGLIFKSKRDNLFGIGAMVDNKKNINFTIDLYTKL